MLRRLSYNLLILTGSILTGLIGRAQSPSNKPTSATQVPTPSGTVATTPGSYIMTGQSPLVNFVRERDAMGRITDTVLFGSAGFIDVKETTHFFDGLGRAIQTVARQITPGNDPQDLVTPVIYDPFGREVYKYLPYVATTGNTNDGSFKQDPFTDQKNFYQNVYPAQQPAYTGEQVFYGQTNFEASPLNRPLKTLAAGNSWAGSDTGVSMQYLVNTPADSVRIWLITNDTLTFSGNNITTNIPTTSASYDSGALYKNVTIDEQGHAVVEYKDKEGQMILKKVQVGMVASDFSGYNGWLCTYYVYDDLNQLRFVMSPKATNTIYTNSWNVSTDTTCINELCFRYEYDYRQRMLGKKVPGAGWVYMVYDLRDRLVYTQDANMRTRNQWMATLYDGLNRAVTTGMLTYSGNRSDLQSIVNTQTASSTTSTVTVSGSTPSALAATLDLDSTENGDFRAINLISFDDGFQTPDTVDFTAEIVSGPGSGNSFSDTLSVVASPLPSGANFIPLTMSFYDDYTHTGKVYAPGYNSLLDEGTNQHAEVLPTLTDNQAVPTIGLATGSMVRVIEDPSDLTKGQWLGTATFYDDRVRVVQTQSDNYKGGADTMTARYNFTGQPITTYLAHTDPAANGVSNTRIKTNMDYDHANRLTQVYKEINDADSTKRLIVQHTYDQLSQMNQKQLGQLQSGGSFLETQDYTYNIRGWLKGINKDYASNDNSHGRNSRWFGMELSYDWGCDHNSLNGNIAGEKWRSKGDGQQRSYGFGYDPLNRLLYADFNQYTDSTWNKTAGLDFSTLMGNGTDPTTAYDENGNIKAMYQMGWKLGGSNPIDSLSYKYFASTNKLKNVIDGRNDPATTLGDFRTSSLSPYSTGKTDSAQDYYYDPNGNMIRDLNKDIGSQTVDGIIYNHLNLPWQISVRSATGTKGTITYIYDAAGTKLKKTTIDSAGGIETVTTYLGTFQYQGTAGLGGGTTIPADTLKFLGHEEGRVRVLQDTVGGQNTTSFKYDYFLKDHLGNIRMVLTDEQETDMYPAATMEPSDSSLENLYYSKLDSTRALLPSGYPTDTTTNPNSYVIQLQGSGPSPKIGPGITLKVMAGDQFSIRVSSWYKLNGSSPSAPINPMTDLLSALISGVGGLPSGGHPTITQLTGNSSGLSDNITKFLADTTSPAINQTRPHAFVNWVLFDNQLNFVASSSGFDQVGADQELHKHILTNLSIDESGYLYIYLSNETPNIPVFFDNLQVTHVRGPMLEEDHYYPFGLALNGISDKALKENYSENKYRFNKGSELQNHEFEDGSGLEVYETQLRDFDPQIGRWWGLDSKASDEESPYSSMENNPILHNDPLGDTTILPSAQTRTPAQEAELERSLNQHMEEMNAPGDNTPGVIHLPSEAHKEQHPIAAGFQTVGYYGSIAFGIKGFDIFLSKTSDPGTTTGERIEAGLDALRGLPLAGAEGVVEGPVEKYEVGEVSDLKSRSVTGDNLDIHHVPQQKPASNIIDQYDPSNAPGIALPREEHLNVPRLKGDNTAGNARQQLAKDIRDLRNNTNAPNSSLQKLIIMNKRLYPEAFRKK